MKRKPRWPGEVVHECGPACPEMPGGNVTEFERRAAFAYHQEELESALYEQLARRQRWAAGRRPSWWWDYSEEAAPYRDHPETWRLPWMHQADADHHAAVTEPDEHGDRSPGRPGQLLDQLARLTFLAASGQLEEWEAGVLLEHPGDRARAVRAGLEMRPRTVLSNREE